MKTTLFEAYCLPICTAANNEAMEATKRRFWREDSPWPFVHAVVPLAVYVSLRHLLVSLLLIYVWETVETLLGIVLPFFKEPKLNSLVSDPLVGTASILVFVAFEAALDNQAEFLAAASATRRITALVLIGALSPLAALGDRTETKRWSLRYGALLYALLYFIVVIVAYAGVASSVRSSLVVWITLLVLYALAVTPIAPERYRGYASAWSRIIYSIVAAALAALVTAIVLNRRQ